MVFCLLFLVLFEFDSESLIRVGAGRAFYSLVFMQSCLSLHLQWLGKETSSLDPFSIGHFLFSCFISPTR